MIFDCIKTDTVFKITVGKIRSYTIDANDKIGFLKHNIDFQIYIDNKIYSIQIEKHNLNDINLYLIQRKYPAVVTIIDENEQYLTIEVIFFSKEIVSFPEALNIGLNDKFLKELDKITKNNNIDKNRNYLLDKICFDINGESYFLSISGASGQSEIYSDEINALNNKKEKILKKNTDGNEIDVLENSISEYIKDREKMSFCIFADGFKLPIEKRSTQNNYTITRIIRQKKSLNQPALSLIKAKINFEDKTNSVIMSQRLEEFRKDKGGEYLETWHKYLEKEVELLLKKTRDIGEIIHEEPIRIVDGYEMKLIGNNYSRLEAGDYVMLSDIEPIYIQGRDIRVDEYFAQLDSFKDNNAGIKISNFEITKINKDFLVIKTEESIDFSNKKMYLSIYGDETQLKRKLEARKRLLEGKSANPKLMDLVSDNELSQLENIERNGTKILPLTDFVKNKIFKHEPTKNQEDAIRIALNTPDIAIIQGPPGTGKTTVLTAILERLNEEADKTQDKYGSVLVTALQHDAVENIIERLKINGLPTPKFGSKSKDDSDLEFYDRVENFSNEIIQNAKKEIPELENEPSIKALEGYFEAYVKTPSKKFALNLLNFILDNMRCKMDNELIERTEHIKNKIEKEVQNNNIDIKDLYIVYAIRTTEKGLLDDGLDRNSDLLYSNFANDLTNEEKELLKKRNIDNIQEYLKNLRILKLKLLSKILPKPEFKKIKVNSEIITLRDNILVKLENNRTKKDKINAILLEYIDELDNNPLALKNAIEDYSFVFSSTTGQSIKTINKKEEKRQKENKPNNMHSYDVVAIDEAARVTPLDLIVVMVLAKQKMILVGDHRQLPHMINEEIVNSGELKENEYIENSMFGFLKSRAQKLKDKDGIIRTITLNNQYRMHPILGNFVSKNFYDEYGEGFNSPLDAKYFTQNLDGIENTPAIWVNVSNQDGDEKGGMGYSRECEAIKTVQLLKRWINSEEGKKLTFGVITFYRKQVDLIQAQIDKNLTKEERENFYDRFRLGTVDSFQGMEFDIVFLSVVRSRSINKIKLSTKDYQLFGFLISKNRLCVSMSRQKKTLIVVGDMEYFDSDVAREYVPSIYNYLQLCKKQGKVL